MKDRFTVYLEHINAYEFRVKFDLPGVADLELDEPPPLGQGNGANASRLLVAAVANCLSASLLFCLEKDQAGSQTLKAEAQGELVRDDNDRLRIGQIHVSITLGDELCDNKRFHRCAQIFEDYCVVTESVRRGIPVAVSLYDGQGRPITSP